MVGFRRPLCLWFLFGGALPPSLSNGEAEHYRLHTRRGHNPKDWSMHHSRGDDYYYEYEYYADAAYDGDSEYYGDMHHSRGGDYVQEDDYHYYASQSHRRRTTPEDDAPDLDYGGDHEDEVTEDEVPCAIETVAGQNGSAACPCVTYVCADEYVDDIGCLRSPLEVEGYNGASPCYRRDYGMGHCLPWDKNVAPFCGKQGSEGNPDLEPGSYIPDFCGKAWCYVDPDNCYDGVQAPRPHLAGGSQGHLAKDVPKVKQPVLSKFFPGRGVYYSYETCGSDGDFVNTIAFDVLNEESIAGN